MQAISWPMMKLLCSEYDFSQYSKILDLGGGNGAIALKLSKAFPLVRFGIMNVPSGVKAARNFLKQKVKLTV